MRPDKRLRTFGIALGVVAASFLVSLKAMDWLSPSGSVNPPSQPQLRGGPSKRCQRQRRRFSLRPRQNYLRFGTPAQNPVKNFWTNTPTSGDPFNILKHLDTILLTAIATWTIVRF